MILSKGDLKRNVEYGYEEDTGVTYPEDLKKEFPLPYKVQKINRDQEIEDIFTGKDDRLILIIGPCSADREDAVLDYMNRLAVLQEKVKDKIFMIPRVYTNKPRTKGVGYKGMLHQPDPHSKEDMLKGIIAIRKLHLQVCTQTGFTCARDVVSRKSCIFIGLPWDMLPSVKKC